MKKKKPRASASGVKKGRYFVPPVEKAGGTEAPKPKYFKRPIAEIVSIPEPEIKPESDGVVWRNILMTTLNEEGKGIEFVGEIVNGLHVVRVEGSYPGWRLIETIPANRVAEMIEKLSIWLEATRELPEDFDDWIDADLPF